ncbi:MAG TPA: hypothetical protein ENI31_03345 [Candidatus Omnitrophica bacterium]|nr:hypothetical protein [Candidatus Omnitrophota bacterium]
MNSSKIITQIGSLPYTDVKEAVDYSLKHDIPFLPELPKRGDAMLEYIKHPGKLSCLEEFKKHKFSLVKVQCVGPATLIQAGYSKGEAISRIYEHISQILEGLSAQEIILFLDEPALGYSGVNFKELWEVIFSNFKVIPGVHICGNMNWDEVFSSSVEIISFDASKYDITKYSKYRSGKRISWGVEKREDIKDFKPGDLITLPCGMGSSLYNPEDPPRYLEKLRKIAGEVSK